MAGERAANNNKNASIIKRRQRVVTIVLAWALLVLAAIPTIVLWQRIDGIIPFTMVAVLIGYPAGVLILLAIEKIRPAKLLLIFGFWATTTFGAYLSGGGISPLSPSLASVILLTGVLFNWRAALVMGAVSGVTIVGLIALQFTERLPDPVLFTSPEAQVGAWVATLMLLVVLVFVGQYSIEDAARREYAAMDMLIESEAHLAAAQALVRLGSWWLDPTTKAMAWSDEMYRLLGHTPGEIQPSIEALINAVVPDQRERVATAINHILHDVEVPDRIFILLLPDGRQRVIEAFAHQIYAEDGSIKRIVGAILDITDLRKAELRIQQANRELLAAYDQTLEGWARALEIADRETESHARRVTELALALAEAMGLDKEAQSHLKRGALLHDVGKMGIPSAVLGKPGKLDTKERALIEQHPTMGYKMLAHIHFLQPALAIPLFHHERWDGSGYPWQLKGEQIPLLARIFAVVDVYDALTSDRPYRQAVSHEEATHYLAENAGSLFDPTVVEIFLALLKTQRSEFDAPNTESE